MWVAFQWRWLFVSSMDYGCLSCFKQENMEPWKYCGGGGGGGGGGSDFISSR
jgi:hypothetical protein